jgi:G:T/U-mismatch repair DNA glycosylase
LRDGFDVIWEADRSSGTNGSFVSTLKTNDYVEPENDSWKMLEEVTRKWAAKK